jgi:acyl-coenzyme A thioesterase PaaI-like protein
MLDQAAVHCATFVTSYKCPTLTMTANYLRAGTGRTFVATAGFLAVTNASAVIDAELTDERDRLISSASVVVQVVNDVARFRLGSPEICLTSPKCPAP